MKVTTHRRKLANAGQSLYYRERLELRSGHSFDGVPVGGIHKLRIEICSDSYAFQCYARIERWDGSQWQEVEHVHHGNMETPNSLAYAARGPEGEEAQWQKFEHDRDTLLEAAAEVLLP